MTDDELDINVRAPGEVARRAIVIGALLRRLWLESLASAGSGVDVEAEIFDIRAWLQTETIWDRLSPAEMGCLQTPAGALDEDACAAIAWQTEGLATLAWSLGHVARLTSKYLDDVPAAIESVPAPWDDATTWLARATLRPESDIARERDHAEILYWRVGVESPRRLASGETLTRIQGAIAAVAREASAAGIISDVADGDFLVAGQRLESIEEDDLENLAALAEQRLRALNWLCGYGETWDEVPLDV